MSWETAVVFTYFAIVSILAVFGLHRCYMVFLYKKHRANKPRPKGLFPSNDLPRVTIQLPIFNELYVVERLLDAVAAIDYPRDRLDVQLLDDSTDETQVVAARKVAELRAGGLDVSYVRRDNRHGFKAGALAEGLKTAKGEFIAIFDADFLPTADMLRETIHFFTDSEIGMVQTRWGHINREFSLLTQVQSILLDGHFVIEHTARNRSGRFFNFNGTAGVWRRSTIESAGGWQHDTLTEDLDLSYRAQMKGWRFVFLQDVVSPAEVPVEMNAFKSQQHRWAKGSIQTCKKVLPAIWRSNLPLRVKVEASFHLTSNFAYVLMVLMSMLMLPTMLYRARQGAAIEAFAFDASLFLAASVSVIYFYIVSQKEIDANWRGKLKYLPFLTSVGIGLSVNNAKAVLEAMIGHQTAFKRTPKYNVSALGDPWKNKKYAGIRSKLPFFELSLGIYFAIVVGVAIAHGLVVSSVFMCLFLVGFTYVGLLSLFQRPGRIAA
ncbi:MAG: glycosyltransferase [Planctomycetes bacterium]|nr:glycosyltransferase [Planctomycetota bacterium]MBI3847288.1 glycosyltransferase [Planctomycetota bacterium]